MSSEGVSGFTSFVFVADCDSETIFMLLHVHRLLVLDVKSPKMFNFLLQIPVCIYGSDLGDDPRCPAVF